MHYLIEWKGCNEFDFVPSKVVNVNSPEMVIEFLASLCGEIENTPGVEAYLCQLEVPDSDSEDAAPPAKTNGVNGHSKKAEDETLCFIKNKQNKRKFTILLNI